MPIVFADSRQLAEEWTYRFLAAAAAHHSAAGRQRPVPDRLGTTAASALAVDRNLEGAADLPQAGIGETAEPFDEHPDRDALDQVEVDGRTTRDRVVAGFEDDLAGERADGCRAWRDLKPIGEGSESWQEWTALLLLSQADLLAGCESESGIDTLRLTAAGQRALDPSQRDPLDEATAKLRTGARVDAIVTAVERALGGRLKQLAANNGAATTRPDGSPLNLNGININLRGAGVYGEADRAQVEAWLKVRNDLAHAHPTVPSDARIEAVIAGIRALLDDHPA